MRKMRNAYKILAGKPEGKGVLERPRHIWKDNIKMILKLYQPCVVTYTQSSWLCHTSILLNYELQS
jgi:hypothetical protein